MYLCWWKDFSPPSLPFHWENIALKKLKSGITLHRNKELFSHENTNPLVSENTFMQSQIWCWLATQDSCFSLFLDNEESPCELLKVVALYPAPFVIGELTPYIAQSKNPQVSLVVKIQVPFVKVISDWIIVITGSSKIPHFIYLQNKTFIFQHFLIESKEISPRFLTFN